RDKGRDKGREGSPSAERAVEERHGRHFATFGSDAALEALSARGGELRHRQLALELDNLVAACRRALARGDGSTAVATWRAAWEVLAYQGPFSLGVALGAEVCTSPGI